MSRIPMTAKWLVLGLIALIGPVLVAELGARLYFLVASGHSSERFLIGTVAEYDPLIGVRLVPRAHAEFVSPEFETHFETNSQRLRESEPTPYARPPGTRYRILLCGNSFTFGHGVNDPERYGEKLESLIPGLDVVNMAVWGTGTDQQYLLYLEEGRKYDVDLVVLGYFVENIVRNGTSVRFATGGIAHKPRYVLRDGELTLTNVPVPRPEQRPARVSRERQRWNQMSERGGALPIPFKDFVRTHSAFYELMYSRLGHLVHRVLRSNPEPYPQYDEARDEWKVTRALFSAFADAVHDDGSDFLLMVIPADWYVLYDHVAPTPNRMIADYARSRGIAALDLLPAFRAIEPARRSQLYYHMDDHWTPEGHLLAAQSLAAYLSEHYGWKRAGARAGGARSAPGGVLPTAGSR
jgi:hypothetical protein